MSTHAPDVALAFEARQARDRVRQAATDLERCRGMATDPELEQLASAALHAADVLLVSIGELRHRLAERAMIHGYAHRR